MGKQASPFRPPFISFPPAPFSRTLIIAPWSSRQRSVLPRLCSQRAWLGLFEFFKYMLFACCHSLWLISGTKWPTPAVGYFQPRSLASQTQTEGKKDSPPTLMTWCDSSTCTYIQTMLSPRVKEQAHFAQKRHFSLSPPVCFVSHALCHVMPHLFFFFFFCRRPACRIK